MAPTAKLPLRKSFFGKGSIEVSPPPPEGGEGGVRRLAVTAEKLMTEPSPDVKTIPDVLEHAVKKCPNKRAVGWREVVRIHEEKKVVKKVVNGVETEETKTWSFFELGDPQFWTFTEYHTAIVEVAKALLGLGIEKDDVTNIYAQTSPTWQLLSQACAMISTPIATSYETLGPEGLTHSINEPNCRTIFTNAGLLPALYKVLPNTPSIKYVIFDGQPSGDIVEKIAALERDGDKIKLLHLDELRKLGRESKDITDATLAARRPTPESVACIMYTSGSTGTPKGVELMHSNLIASVGSVYFLYHPHVPDDTVYLAYLPLAHIFEYIVELVAIYACVTSVYARPKTLTDQSVRNCKGDLTAFQPTVMLGVPAVWEQIRKGVVGKLDTMGWVAKTLVGTAMTMKKKSVPVLGWLLDKYILAGVRQPTGGRIRWAINGGSAICKETQEFISLGITPLMQGYGLTETCGLCTATPPELHRYNSVGLPVPSMEIKLVDIPDMGYSSKHNPPQGEIWVRGPGVTRGYYKRPDLNSDESIFTKDGWFRTGDVGQWNSDGTLSIIDRLKNLIKLQNGEYIALEKLECIYKSCDLVNTICAYATPDADQPIGIVVPHEVNLRQVVRSTGIADADAHLDDLCKDHKVRTVVLEAINDTGKKDKFKQAELLKGVVLTPDEWTPESGLLTAAMKINRATVSKKWRDEIVALYA